MIKILSILGCVFLFFLFANIPTASSEGSNLVPRCGGVFHLCGYTDRYNKTEIISKKFEIAYPFSEGVAGVRIKGRFGFIDQKGNIVIKPEFEAIGDFHQGLVETLLKGKVGVIDKTGEIVLEHKFNRAIPFTKDVIFAKTFPAGFKKKRTSRRLRRTDAFLTHFTNPFGLYHLKKGWITDQKFFLQEFKTGRGIVWATIGKSNKRLYGLLKSDGTWLTKPKFTSVNSLNDDRAIVTVPINPSSSKVFRNRSSGAVDENGKLVIPTEYDWLGSWRNGYGIVKKGNKRGLINKQGKILGGIIFEKLEPPTSNLLARGRLDGKWYSIRADGALIKDELESKILASCDNGILVRKKGDKSEIYNKNGELIFQEPVASVVYKNNVMVRLGLEEKLDCTSPIAVKQQGKFRFISSEGRLLFKDKEFDNAPRFIEGRAIVKENGKWGIIDLTGSYILPPKYDEIWRTLENKKIFRVTHIDARFWIDIHGNKVLKPILSLEKKKINLRCFGESERFEQNGLWGIRLLNGTILIEPKYRAISCFGNGVAWAPFDTERQWCPLQPDGKKSKYLNCRVTYYPYQQSYSYAERFSEDPYNSSVLWNRAYLDFWNGNRKSPTKMRPGRL